MMSISKLSRIFQLKLAQRNYADPSQKRIHANIHNIVVQVLSQPPFSLNREAGDYTGEIKKVLGQAISSGYAALPHWKITINLSPEKSHLKQNIYNTLSSHLSDMTREEIVIEIN